jgi:hypothetical protein
MMVAMSMSKVNDVDSAEGLLGRLAQIARRWEDEERGGEIAELVRSDECGQLAYWSGTPAALALRELRRHLDDDEGIFDAGLVTLRLAQDAGVIPAVPVDENLLAAAATLQEARESAPAPTSTLLRRLADLCSAAGASPPDVYRVAGEVMGLASFDPSDGPDEFDWLFLPMRAIGMEITQRRRSSTGPLSHRVRELADNEHTKTRGRER